MPTAPQLALGQTRFRHLPPPLLMLLMRPLWLLLLLMMTPLLLLFRQLSVGQRQK
jgi:hypothetical protein